MKIKERVDKAGVPIKAHSLRHYFATNLMERGANIKQVQELVGHESLATTQIYLSLMADHLENAIQLLEYPLILSENTLYFPNYCPTIFG